MRHRTVLESMVAPMAGRYERADLGGTAILPGMPFPGSPDTYPTKDPVAGYLNGYATAFNLPVRPNARVTQPSRTENGFEVRTQDAVFRAHQVVVATGPFQVPFVPLAAQRLDGSVTQLHSAA